MKVSSPESFGARDEFVLVGVEVDVFVAHPSVIAAAVAADV